MPVRGGRGGSAAGAVPVLLRMAVGATFVAALLAVEFGDRWGTLAPVALPAVLVGPMLPWRAAARLAGFTVVAAVLVGCVGAGGVGVGRMGEEGWWRCGHPVLLAVVSAGAAAVRGWVVGRHAAG